MYKVGDFVSCTYKTKSGKEKCIQGKVVALRPNSAKIQHEVVGRCSWQVVESWKPLDLLAPHTPDPQSVTLADVVGILRDNHIRKESL